MKQPPSYPSVLVRLFRDVSSKTPPDNGAGARNPMRFPAGVAVCVLAALTILPGCGLRRSAAPAIPATPLPSTASSGSPTTTSGSPTAEKLLDTGTTIAGEAISYPTSAVPQVTAQVVTIEPGQSTGWHRHSVPTFGYIFSGRIEVEYDGLGRRTLRRGDRLMEAMQTAHNGVNLGTEPVRILVVSMGAQGKPAVIQSEPPAMPRGLAEGRHTDLVELASIDPRLRIDLRYATTNNFTGNVVYPAARAFLQRPAAHALARAGDRARARGYGLMILDAYRPWSVTRMFWDSYPMHRSYLADPLQGSRHNRGCAVDLTLFDLASGEEVKMPSAYDDFSERAHPHYEGGSAAERAARDLLRELMEAEGFTVYENEWWHFDHTGWREYPVLDVSLEDVATARPHGADRPQRSAQPN